jgi:hypothetical protein
MMTLIGTAKRLMNAEQAERAHSPLDKERWLRLAGNWVTIAQEADKRSGIKN